MRPPYDRKPCRQCQSLFLPVRDWHVFCSERCREQWYTEFYVEVRKFKRARLEQQRKERHATKREKG